MSAFARLTALSTALSFGLLLVPPGKASAQTMFKCLKGTAVTYSNTSCEQLGLKDVVVQSEGSVGLDETIDFRITVPIPDKWTSGKPLLANLQGEVIPLEMQGTLDQPQLDGRALANFGKQIGFKSAGGLLQQLIEKRLDQEPDGEVPATPRPRRQR